MSEKTYTLGIEIERRKAKGEFTEAFLDYAAAGPPLGRLGKAIQDGLRIGQELKKAQRVRIWELSTIWASNPELMAQIREITRPNERGIAPNGDSATTTSTG